MNELVTPPGYVEYPRDPKFRTPEDHDRLLRMAKAYQDFPWMWPLYILITSGLEGSRPASWWALAIPSVVVLFLAFVVRRGLIDIFQAKDRPDWEATLGAMIPAVFGVLCATRMPGQLVFGILYMASFLAIYGMARMIVFREAKKFDPELPLTFGLRRLGFTIGVMQAEAELKPPVAMVGPEVG